MVLCDPCVCVVGMLGAFRGVDRWELADLASVGAGKDFAYSAIPRLPSLLVVENKRKDKFPLDSRSAFIQISKSHLPTRCPTSEFGLDWFGM